MQDLFRQKNLDKNNLGSVKAVRFEEEQAIQEVEEDLFGDTNDDDQEENDEQEHEEPAKLNLEESFVPKLKPSTKQALVLELKELPSHLKYFFLGNNNTLPVIISAHLDKSQEKTLLKILRKYMTAIGWTIADTKGIGPTTCMHHIYEEEDAIHSGWR